MKPNSIAIFFSNDRMPRSADSFFPFRQNPDLFFLTGIEQEETVLVLFPDCPKTGFQEILFLKKATETTAIWDGQTLKKEEARKISGIEKIVFSENVAAALHELVLLADAIYLNLNEADRFSSPVLTNDLRQANIFREKYPLHEFHRAAPILKKLAMVKGEIELEILGKCAEITAAAFHRVLNFVRPGVWEFEIEAEITHEFLRHRATGHAFDPIVATGKNACVIHYKKNAAQCLPGDALLLDFGCDYSFFNSDFSRTIPVSGVFSKRQRTVYNAVLRILKEARQLLVPGNDFENYQKEVGKILSSELVALGLLTREEVEKSPEDKPAYRKFCPHGISHHLGQDVHDRSHRHLPFREGMVFTCEPGIYIPEEGLGVRLENVVFVSGNEPVDLYQNIPIEVAEIEDLMASK